MMKRERLHAFYSGRVQGVGFRFTVKMVAHGFDVTGTVRNMPDGRVELVAEGERAELEQFLKAIQDSEVGAFIRNEEKAWAETKNEFSGFEIIR
jgi:acylphosphatase